MSSLKSISTNPKYAKALEWSKVLAMTGFSQMIIQALALIGGIIVIRLLPTNEYALYTLANAMLGTISILADGGISNSVLAQGGKVWQDKKALGTVLVTGIDLRRKFALVSLSISLPILIYLLLKHGASVVTACLIAASLVPAFYAALTDALYEVPVKLNQDIKSLQKNQVLANCGRFLMLAVSLFFLPFTFMAMLANGIPRIWANYKLRKITTKFADLSQSVDTEVRGNIVSMVKRTLPGSIYYCISGQISIWIISFYGNTSGIAEVGALGRLTAGLALITTVVTTVVVPRFARLKASSNILLARYIQIMLLLIFLSVAVCGIVYLFPTQVLSILGKEYLNLEVEVLLMSIIGCLYMIYGVSLNLSVARGWVLPPVLYILADISLQLALIYFLDLSTTKMVLVSALILITMNVLMSAGYFCYKIFKTSVSINTSFD